MTPPPSGANVRTDRRHPATSPRAAVRKPGFWLPASVLVVVLLVAVFPSFFAGFFGHGDPRVCDLGRSGAPRMPATPSATTCRAATCSRTSSTARGRRSRSRCSPRCSRASSHWSWGRSGHGGRMGRRRARPPDRRLPRVPVPARRRRRPQQRRRALGADRLARALALFGWPTMARLVRSSVRSVRNAEFVLAARTMGLSTWRITTRYVLPSSVSPLLVLATITVGGVIVSESSLTYLGIDSRAPPSPGGSSSPPPPPSSSVPHMLIAPAAFLAITVLSVIALGDTLRAALDPTTTLTSDSSPPPSERTPRSDRHPRRVPEDPALHPRLGVLQGVAAPRAGRAGRHRVRRRGRVRGGLGLRRRRGRATPHHDGTSSGSPRTRRRSPPPRSCSSPNAVPSASTTRSARTSRRSSRAAPPIADATLRELMEMGAGVIRDGHDGDYWSLLRPFPDEQELLALVLDRGQKVPAGSSFNYSNLGYSLLGLVIAAVSGRSYNDFVRESITEPLGSATPAPTGTRRGGRLRRRVTPASTRTAVVTASTTSTPGRWPPRPGSTARRPTSCGLLSQARHRAGLAPQRPLEAARPAQGVELDRRRRRPRLRRRLRRRPDRGPRGPGALRRLPRPHHQSMFDPASGLVVSVLTAPRPVPPPSSRRPSSRCSTPPLPRTHPERRCRTTSTRRPSPTLREPVGRHRRRADRRPPRRGRPLPPGTARVAHPSRGRRCRHPPHDPREPLRVDRRGHRLRPRRPTAPSGRSGPAAA